MNYLLDQGEKFSTGEIVVKNALKITISEFKAIVEFISVNYALMI
jgi:hypothetical protein